MANIYKELVIKSKDLKSKAIDMRLSAFKIDANNIERAINVRNEQNKLWKKMLFFQELLKEFENVKKD